MTGKNEPNQNTTVNSQSLTEKLAALYRSQNTLPKLIEDTKIKAQSLDEYYVKLQILLNEDDEAGKAALRDKVAGDKKLVEPENIFKAVDIKRKVKELLCKILEDKDDSEKIKRIMDIINTEKEENNKINLVHKELGKNNIEEIKNIIESINRIQADIGKILLLGGAGVGKTTLLHNISYKWGKGDLWNDKFDYVFRVKLKELLNESWSREYEPSELRQDKIGCFIHYCLTHSAKFTKSEKMQLLKDILSIEEKQKDKVLLLLDGYDEVAHLNMSNRNDFKDIMDEVSEHKNVIMSSRPNALVDGMSSQFERKVENTGWDTEGIEKYINKNFEDDKDKKFGVQLKSFLAVNSQIKEICEIPINTALICLVWNDKDTREKLQKDNNEDFNISQLYQEVVIWLGKKYFKKFENQEVENVCGQQIFLKKEVQFLQKVAYESLVKTGKLVESTIIQKNLGKLDIGKINNFGLLKAEGSGREIINLNHQFIHLTFQEYLTARYLKDQLINDNIKSKIASFIGEHRNEPKYLMILKFLAGIVSNNIEDKNLIIRFWEAVTCNVDGTLELGLETKVTLLMHLLVQSKVSGKLDSNIPNLNKIQKLIDDTVLKDITSWKQQIVESGYLSEAIIKIINEKLQNKQIELEELKTVIEIITSLSNRNELGGKTKIYEQLVDLLQIKDQVLQKLVLEKLIQIIDGTIEQKILQISLKAIIELLKSSNDDVKSAAARSLTEVVKVMPSLAEEAYKELVELIKSSNDYVKSEVASSLPEVVKAMPAEEAYKELVELIKSSNDDTKAAAVRSLPQVVKVMPSLAEQAFKKISKLSESSNYNVKHDTAISLSAIAQIEPKLALEVFNTLEKQLSSNLSIVSLSLLKVVKVMSELTAFKVLQTLQALLTTSNYNVKSEIFKSLVELVKVMPELVGQTYDILYKQLNDFNNNYIKSSILRNLFNIINIMSVQERFNILKGLLINSNHDIKDKVIRNLLGVVKVKPELAKEIFNILQGQLVSSNDDVKWAVTTSLSEVVKVEPELAKKRLAYCGSKYPLSKTTIILNLKLLRIYYRK